MINRFGAFLVTFLLLTLGASHAAYSSAGPTLILKNQFGEQSTNFVLPGGSNQIDINFIVDSTNGNGLGIRSLKGAGVSHVYMHTSATPAAGSPNPSAGYIVVQLSKNYSAYVGGYTGFVQPVSGTPVSAGSSTPGQAYVITSVGSTPQSMWQSIGLALGIIPSVGQAFVAVNPSPSAAPTGSGSIQTPAVSGSGVGHIEVIGDPNTTVGATGGATIVLAVMQDQIPIALPSPSPISALKAAVAPANGTVVGMRFVYQ